jgi:FtsP/CotA-like multicopper oxidase with cupredoxin domain
MTNKLPTTMSGEAAPARRGFLKALGLSAGAAAAASPLVAPSPAAARESTAEARKARYQPTSAHVQAFYRTNRYEQ